MFGGALPGLTDDRRASRTRSSTGQAATPAMQADRHRILVGRVRRHVARQCAWLAVLGPGLVSEGNENLPRH